MIILFYVILSFCASGLTVSPTRPTAKPRKCTGINESWQIGHGGCDPTCENPDKRCRGAVDGCFCKPRFVRENGICISRDACPKKCTGINESWQIGHGGCDPSCDNPDHRCRGAIDGCFCNPRFVRENGICISRDACPKKCNGVNELWQAGHGGCDPTCKNPDLVCEAIVDGCFCKPRFVRENGVCIDVKDCAEQVCEGKNESFQRCHGGCEGTCDDPNPMCKACATGCFCKPGYVRENGECINKDTCVYIKRSSYPSQNCSGQNEIWRTCFGGCDPTCREPEKKCYGSVDGCFCIDGYVRDENNYCIKKEECVQLNCNEDEVPDWCPDNCKFDMTCDRLIRGIIAPCLPPRIPHVCEPRCYCKPGLVRENDICVPQTICCGKYERLVKCPAKCDYTVKDGPPKPDCELRPCSIYGCQCLKHYARNENDVCVYVESDECHG